jgi:two-component system, response regulator PdtaR
LRPLCGPAMQPANRSFVPEQCIESNQSEWNKSSILLVYGRVTNMGVAMAVILIVEDEAQVRVLSESYLQEQGHQTLSAATPGEALAVLDANDAIDILFTDIELQGDLQAGFNLAQKAIGRHPELRVLYTSCHAITDGMKAMFVEGAAFLAKPYTIDQLQAILAVDFGVKPHPAPIPRPGAGGQALPGL